ncbi:MAG: class I SAM-dependent methyltransferase [Candidatus Geothermincolia bacterium]
MEDLFKNIAVDYDKMFPRDFMEDNRMLRQLFRGHHVKTVLDCACGTGAHVAMLASQGFQVTGSDFSEVMLERARLRLESEGLAATLVQARWGSLPQVFDNRFDAVICIGNSLPIAGSDELVQEAVSCMYEVLAPGGVLVIQNRNMDKMVRERPATILNEADEKGSYTLFVFEYLDPLVIYKIFYIVTGGSHDVTYSEFPMNILTRAKLEKMLERAGAGSWKVYGDSHLSVFSRDKSPRMIVVAYK